MDKENPVGFVKFSEAFDQMTKERRARNIENICKYGISLLDDVLGGIMENELVVIGAGTGIGKTELASSIAIENALRGKKVALLSLEGDVYEVCYRYGQKAINRDKRMKGQTLISGPSYRLNIEDSNYNEDLVKKSLDQKLDNLWIFKKEKIPNKDELIKMIHDNFYKFDIFIIDHLHYLSFSSENERSGISEIIRAVKEATEITRVPIIMVSHLSGEHTKKDRLPNTYDLHGSTDIGKNANTVILLSKGENEILKAKPETRHLAPTKIIIAKNRTGVPTPTVIDATFDTLVKEYKKGANFNKINTDFNF